MEVILNMIIYYVANYQYAETIIVSFKKRGASDLGRVARAHFSFSSPLEIDESRVNNGTTEKRGTSFKVGKILFER
jgi:hypothetical protein